MRDFLLGCVLSVICSVVCGCLLSVCLVGFRLCVSFFCMFV